MCKFLKRLSNKKYVVNIFCHLFFFCDHCVQSSLTVFEFESILTLFRMTHLNNLDFLNLVI